MTLFFNYYCFINIGYTCFILIYSFGTHISFSHIDKIFSKAVCFSEKESGSVFSIILIQNVKSPIDKDS